MDNQHKKIRGYRELTQEDIDTMNEIKEKLAELEPLIDKVQSRYGVNTPVIGDTHSQSVETNDDGEIADPHGHNYSAFVEFEHDPLQDESQRWIDAAKMSIQQGGMFLTRAVTRPDFF